MTRLKANHKHGSDSGTRIPVSCGRATGVTFTLLSETGTTPAEVPGCGNGHKPAEESGNTILYRTKPEYLIKQ